MPKENSTKQKPVEKAPISVREVEVDVWRDFRKLAMLNDMTLPEYLKKLVTQEMAHVHID